MSTCLINLENYSYQDYLDINEFINETFTESNEVNKMLEEFKKVVVNLDDDLESFDKEKVEKLLDNLDKNATKINVQNKNIYKTISTISTLIQFIETIISICKFFKVIKGFVTDQISRSKNAEELFNSLPKEEQKALLADKKAFKKWWKQAVKDPVSFKEKVKNGIKDFFTVKTLILKALSIINKMIGARYTKLLSYEQNVDKAYELLLNCEAKMMTEKRRAKSNNDTTTEENCDAVIEFIENLKKERVKARELARRAQNESTILESERSENKINNFRLVCRDIAEALDIEKENMKAYCDTALYVVRRSLELTEENKDKKIDLIEDKIKKTEDFVSNIDRVYDKQTIDTLLKKYSSMFSIKYTSFGMKAKENFEKKLASVAKEMNDYIDNYHKQLYILVSGDQTTSINQILNRLEEKVTKKVNQSTYNNIRRIISGLDDKSGSTFDFCKVYIDWCRSNLDIVNIKNTLKYKVLYKLFK